MSDFAISLDLIKQLKTKILSARYHIAKIANSESLKLYFSIGMFLDKEFEKHKWGAKTLDAISTRLQQELPGLRGFSASNMRKMRIFYQEWKTSDLICSSLTNKLQNERKLEDFIAISFSHHFEILLKVKEEIYRWYYINKVAQEFWSVRHLKTELKNQSHLRMQNIPNNFDISLKPALSNKAIRAFKDQYLLDFINVEDADEEIDEKVLEHEIVQNIKKFLMSLGSDFSFMGNQYRLTVDNDEYFIDLLFFHRGLQSLVAFELKKGKFKPEYVGKMNFYLSALDDSIKQPHENPSIGIILCKEKNNKKVEYSFRDFNKPMGVATFKTTEKLPAKYKDKLPDPETLKKLLG
jgi:predicted nuclease of restriction endonuclease-like (RecB) superfamily